MNRYRNITAVALLGRDMQTSPISADFSSSDRRFLSENLLIYIASKKIVYLDGKAININPKDKGI